jgi:hypothetical protein
MPVAVLPLALAQRLAVTPLASPRPDPESKLPSTATPSSTATASITTGATTANLVNGLLRFGSEAPPPPLEQLRSLGRTASRSRLTSSQVMPVWRAMALAVRDGTVSVAETAEVRRLAKQHALLPGLVSGGSNDYFRRLLSDGGDDTAAADGPCVTALALISTAAAAAAAAGSATAPSALGARGAVTAGGAMLPSGYSVNAAGSAAAGTSHTNWLASILADLGMLVDAADERWPLHDDRYELGKLLGLAPSSADLTAAAEIFVQRVSERLGGAHTVHGTPSQTTADAHRADAAGSDMRPDSRIRDGFTLALHHLLEEHFELTTDKHPKQGGQKRRSHDMGSHGSGKHRGRDKGSQRPYSTDKRPLVQRQQSLPASLRSLLSKTRVFCTGVGGIGQHRKQLRGWYPLPGWAEAECLQDTPGAAMPCPLLDDDRSGVKAGYLQAEHGYSIMGMLNHRPPPRSMR